MKQFLSFCQTRAFWLGILVLGTIMIGTALVFQHVLDEPPCIVCIHVRIGVMVMILIAVSAILVPASTTGSLIHQLLLAMTAGSMVERSWNLLGTERGFIMGSCEFTLGLPEWLAIESWLPALFEVQTSCGYTPELLFGITMAEGLLAVFAVLLLITVMTIGAMVLQAKD